MRWISHVKRLRSWVLSALLAFSVGQNAWACAFHGYTPDPTIIDVLFGTEQAVLAHLSPSGRYETAEVLLGPTPPGLPVSVAPAFLAQLKARPGARALLARDGAYGPWMELAVMDERFRATIDLAMEHRHAWGIGVSLQRLQHFADRINDPHPDIHRLALRELDRAPYHVLTSIKLPRINGLRTALETRDTALTPIRVLLAGLSGDRGHAEFLSAELETAVRNDVPYLGAYATALIALNGTEGVRTVLDHYLMDRALTLETRTRLLEALAIQHRLVPPETRRAIMQGVSGVLRQEPALAEAAARQFGVRRNWITATQ